MSKEVITAEMRQKIEKILQSMKRHGIIEKHAAAKDVTAHDLYEFATVAGVGATQPHEKDEPPHPLPLDDLVSQLVVFATVSEVFNKKFAFLDRSQPSPFTQGLTLRKSDNLPPIFGLPSVGQRSSGSLVYQARKLSAHSLIMTEMEKRNTEEKIMKKRKSFDKDIEELETVKPVENESVVIAQKKVAKALFGMVGNETMLFHFVTKGGIEACEKLVRESEY
jgi:NurA-like 5'-3' nuclease